MRVSGIFPPGFEITGSLETFERRLDGAAGQSSGLHDVEAEPAAAGNGVEDGGGAVAESYVGSQHSPNTHAGV